MEGNLMSSVADTEMEACWAAEAIKLLGQGEINGALHYLNLSLDEKCKWEDLKAPRKGTQNDRSPSPVSEVTDKYLSKPDGGIYTAEHVSLLEKRCLIHMKLQHFDEVLNDARRILDKRTDHSLAYKCLLVVLCKTNRLDEVSEILKLWRSYSPQDLDMMKCRTKVEALMHAVKNGIDARDAFSNIEDQLGLSYDWLLARKPQDPRWRHRPLPPGQLTFTLCLPYRFGHCSLGEKCPDAHGEEEGEEWRCRSTLKSVSMLLDTIKLDSGEMYIRKIRDKLLEVDDERVITETLPEGMKIKSSKPLEAVVQAKNMSSYTWTFAVETRIPLTHVCLLHEIHRPYFFISSAFLYGASNKTDLLQNKAETEKQVIQVIEISSPTALALSGKKSSGYAYQLDVTFKPDVYGTFRQTVVFDIGEEMKFIKNITVQVVPSQDPDTSSNDLSESHSVSPTFENVSSFRVGGTWNFGNADMVDAATGEKVASHKLGFALINGSNKAELPSTLLDPLTTENYKEKMRFFLTQEERARQEILAKYNLTTQLTLLDSYMMTAGFNDGLTKYSLDGSLYGKMTLFRDVSEDTAVGRLILRSCNYLLLTKSEEARKMNDNSKIRVYLCPISDKTKNDIYIDVGPACVKELNLKDKESTLFDIQFQLDRTAFMEMKAVIDKLQSFHLDMLFPDFAINYHIPWSPIKQWGNEVDSPMRLNPRQREALIAITTETNKIPPILVIGPFGTGKTFTLAQCIKKLLTQPNIRIMVCTHSNSAADLYIKEYLDPWVQEGFKAATPLRIYYHMRNLNSVHVDVLQYCIIEKLRFRPPTLEEIVAHKVIVVTLSTSYMLMQMNLPKDTFSHILLDEAAQAMESEAITPLMCAGEYTKLVLAGDHMQLSPELFSDEAKSLHPSLLERLHNSYPDDHPCKLMLCENYRSHSSIIEYVSDAFYSRKLECSMVQPVHDKFFPMTFFAARGEEVQEADSTSYFNMAEVFEVAEKVRELVSSWPAKWGSYRQDSAIGVLTPYSDQVSRIRSALRKKGLYSVSVERVLNVQGKQFRAVFLSTVRSFRPWVKILPEAVGNEVDLGFFSNPKLLNTALTRAQSLVAVVGDPVSLCSEGKCRNLWKDYIKICDKNKSLYGISYPQLEQSIAGLEMRITWGLNPLANEFEPKNLPKASFAQPAAAKPTASATNMYNSAPVSNSDMRNLVHNQSVPLTNTSMVPVSQGPALARQPQHVPIQPRPGYPTGFQNPAMWNQGGRVSIPIQPAQQLPFPYRGGYGATAPIQRHQMMYPVQGFPSHTHPGVPVGIPPSPQIPAGAPMVPPAQYIPQNISSRQFQGVPGHPSKAAPQPKIIGNYPSQSLPKPSPQLISATGHPGSPLGRNVLPTATGHRSPMPASVNAALAHSNQNYQPQFPSDQEQFAAGLPLYRRAPVLPNSNSVSLPQQNASYQPTANAYNGSNQSSNQWRGEQLSHQNQMPNAVSQSQPPLSNKDLLLLNDILETYSASPSQSNDTQLLQSKLREAVNIARGLNESGIYGNGAQNLFDTNAGNQTWNMENHNMYQQSQVSALSQQLNDFKIAGSVNDIWASLGLSDEPVRTDQHQHQTDLVNPSNIVHHSGYSGGFNDASNSNPSLNTDYNIPNMRQENFANRGPSNVANVGASEGMGHSQGPWTRNNTIFPEVQAQQSASSFGGLTAQLSSNETYSGNVRDVRPTTQQPESGGGGAGRSYANVVKRSTPAAGPAVPTPTPSTAGYSGLTRNDYGCYYQQNDPRSQQLQQHQQMILPQSLMQDMKKKNVKK